jgi:hypothetical protein
MSFGALVKKVWQNPLARGLDLEDPAHIHAHAKILRSNRLCATATPAGTASCFPRSRRRKMWR